MTRHDYRRPWWHDMTIDAPDDMTWLHATCQTNDTATPQATYTQDYINTTRHQTLHNQCLNCQGGWEGWTPPAIFSTHPMQCQILYWGVSTYSTRTIYIAVWKDSDSQKQLNPPSYFSTIQTLCITDIQDSAHEHGNWLSWLKNKAENTSLCQTCNKTGQLQPTNWPRSSTVCLRPQTDVSTIFYSTVTFNFDLLIVKSKALISVPKCMDVVSFVNALMDRQHNSTWCFWTGHTTWGVGTNNTTQQRNKNGH